MKARNPIPKTKEAWLNDIAQAFMDARKTIPLGKLTGTSIKSKDLFLLAPDACLKFRGIKPTKGVLEKASQAALSSYVATKDAVGETLDNPQISFALCYLASHFGLGILDASLLTEVMGYIEDNKERIIAITEDKSGA